VTSTRTNRNDDDHPRNLKTMLSEAKDTSELMVDLAYAAVFFNDEQMAREVEELEELQTEFVHEMREVCVLAARSPREAEGMSGVLQIVSAIERIGNAAVDIARIVTRRLGIPTALVADLADAEEVSHRVRIREDSAMAGRTLADLELPTEVGMSVVAIRRGKEWRIDPDGDDALVGDDVLILQGAAAGVDELRQLAGAPEWSPPTLGEETVVSDLDRAVDAIVEMKNLSEVGVGLAYSALLYADQGLAAEVMRLEDHLDEMKERLEVWVLRAAADRLDPSPLRGLLHLGQAAESLGDSAQQMVWLVSAGEELHPVLAVALAESDEVIVRVPVAAGSALDDVTLAEADIEMETGCYVLALWRAGRYVYQPRPSQRLSVGDELLATGPEDGRDELARLGGYLVEEDDETGEIELVAMGGTAGGAGVS